MVTSWLDFILFYTLVLDVINPKDKAAIWLLGCKIVNMLFCYLSKKFMTFFDFFCFCFLIEGKVRGGTAGATQHLSFFQIPNWIILRRNIYKSILCQTASALATLSWAERPP